MEIGSLRHRVQILSYRDVPNLDGSDTYNEYTVVKTLWAQIVAVKGLTRIDTKQIGQGITHKITIRYSTNITSENWVKFASRYFRIRDVRDIDERNRWLELMCEEESQVNTSFLAGSDTAGEDLSGE